MIAQRPFAQQVESPLSMPPHQREALRLLRKASDAASKQARDIWQFAVEIERLYAVGLGNTDLRQLLCLGYLEHARERTTARAAQRIFQPLGTLVLPERTCFVLTTHGRELASALDADTNEVIAVPAERPTTHCWLKGVPRWDSERRQLWWQDRLIKEFRRPAGNQETVLSALEEESWPARMDDPLPPKRHIDPKVRLHDTIKSLNRHHIHSLIFFRGDGSGKGVIWTIGRGNEEMFPRTSPERPQNVPCWPNCEIQ